MDDTRCLEPTRRELEAARFARTILGVNSDASAETIKRAWRRACLETHPDRHPNDADAARRFLVVTCAYRVLTEGQSCEDLMKLARPEQLRRSDDKYILGNAWGLFLWWRETFF